MLGGKKEKDRRGRASTTRKTSSSLLGSFSYPASRTRIGATTAIREAGPSNRGEGRKGGTERESSSSRWRLEGRGGGRGREEKRSIDSRTFLPQLRFYISEG